MVVNSAYEALELGICTVYQELELIQDLTVAENIFLSRLPRRKFKLFIDWKILFKRAEAILTELGFDISPRSIIKNLTIGYQQLVEIARVLVMKPRVVIFDEPTAVLTEEESLKLFSCIEQLKKAGVAIIYISHRMKEILKLADKISVLRDGVLVNTTSALNAKNDDIVKMMIGRNIEKSFIEMKTDSLRKVLEVENVSQQGVLQNISFNLFQGEVLGFYGLIGSGRTELARLIFGLQKKDSGKIKLFGKETTIRTPYDAISNGIGFATEDRKSQGLVMNLDISKNISLSNHNNFNKLGFILKSKEFSVNSIAAKQLEIKTPGLWQEVQYLSGGNQQKVIFARWLTHKPTLSILILDEPTRGIDVGAKAEVHKLIRKLADQGMSIIFISSDMLEILYLCDRIMVMREGKIWGELSHNEATEEKIMFMAAHQN